MDDPTKPDDTTLDASARLQLRLQAADLVTRAMEMGDPAERERLLAEARALIAGADRKRGGDGEAH